MSTKTAKPPTPRYLLTNERRILADATMRRVGDMAWLDLQVAGILIRLVLTPEELDQLITVSEQVREQFHDPRYAAKGEVSAP